MADAVADFSYLTNWYAAQCDGDWEHEFGVRLATLDNPGWTLTVDLAGTEAEGRTLDRRTGDMTAGRWLFARSDGDTFEASCDPHSLPEAIAEFQSLVESG